MCVDADAAGRAVYPAGAAASAGPEPGGERIVGVWEEVGAAVAAAVTTDAALALLVVPSSAVAVACMNEGGVGNGGWAMDGAVPAYEAALIWVVPAVIGRYHAGFGVADIELAVDPPVGLGVNPALLAAEASAVGPVEALADPVAVTSAVDPAEESAAAAAAASPSYCDRPPPWAQCASHPYLLCVADQY